ITHLYLGTHGQGRGASQRGGGRCAGLVQGYAGLKIPAFTRAASGFGLKRCPSARGTSKRPPTIRYPYSERGITLRGGARSAGELPEPNLLARSLQSAPRLHRRLHLLRPLQPRFGSHSAPTPFARAPHPTREGNSFDFPVLVWASSSESSSLF